MFWFSTYLIMKFTFSKYWMMSNEFCRRTIKNINIKFEKKFSQTLLHVGLLTHILACKVLITNLKLLSYGRRFSMLIVQFWQKIRCVLNFDRCFNHFMKCQKNRLVLFLQTNPVMKNYVKGYYQVLVYKNKKYKLIY